MTHPEYQLLNPTRTASPTHLSSTTKEEMKQYDYLDQKRADKEAEVKKGWKKVEEELELKCSQEQEGP